ncbi:NAD(P)H-dependent oxidoreductase [Ahrensia kielensis]|nr:NAD(P)H-dependent oxidoreductase [Ahrensia kielensis]
MESLSTKIKDADCFVMVSPEYSHSMSLAQANGAVPEQL